MTAIARLTSDNKVDKMYALKYYANYLICFLIFFLSMYFVYKDLYFNAVVFGVYSIIFYKIKNIYADYSRDSKCKHPNTVTEFLNLINVRKKTGLGELIYEHADGLPIFLYTMMYTFFIGIPIAISIAFISERTGVSPLFYISNFLMGYLLLITMYMVNRDLNNKDINLQKIDFSLIEKTKTIKFSSLEQEEKFFNDIKNHFNLNKKMNRHQLFYIIDNMGIEVDKVNIIDFLSKRVEGKKEL